MMVTVKRLVELKIYLEEMVEQSQHQYERRVFRKWIEAVEDALYEAELKGMDSETEAANGAEQAHKSKSET